VPAVWAGYKVGPRVASNTRVGEGPTVTAAFVFQPATPDVVAGTWKLTVHLDRHPTNPEAARIMALPGYRAIEPLPNGQAADRVERFGRDLIELRNELADTLRRLTSATVIDN